MFSLSAARCAMLELLAAELDRGCSRSSLDDDVASIFLHAEINHNIVTNITIENTEYYMGTESDGMVAFL